MPLPVQIYTTFDTSDSMILLLHSNIVESTLRNLSRIDHESDKLHMWTWEWELFITPASILGLVSVYAVVYSPLWIYLLSLQKDLLSMLIFNCFWSAFVEIAETGCLATFQKRVFRVGASKVLTWSPSNSLTPTGCPTVQCNSDTNHQD